VYIIVLIMASCQLGFVQVVFRQINKHTCDRNFSGHCYVVITAVVPYNDNSSVVTTGSISCYSYGQYAYGVVVSCIIWSWYCIHRSFTTLPGTGSDFMSPGLVQDGTRCGNGRVTRVYVYLCMCKHTPAIGLSLLV
jgi:hypothetical protein